MTGDERPRWETAAMLAAEHGVDVAQAFLLLGFFRDPVIVAEYLVDIRAVSSVADRTAVATRHVRRSLGMDDDG